MNYFISREGKQYGPYTLADLQRYVASGDVLTSDLATSEGMTTPVTVGQIIGNIAAPVAYPASAAMPVAAIYPTPPNLHWGLVLLFTVISCGIFGIVWDIVQGAWMKKVDPSSKAFFIYLGAAACLGLIFFSSFFASMTHSTGSLTGLIQLAYSVTLIVGRFSFKSSMEQHYNSAEPMGLSLSGVMTFFFGGIYFQYHFNDIMKRKMMDQMYGAR
jgi:hypothetical protein